MRTRILITLIILFFCTGRSFPQFRINSVSFNGIYTEGVTLNKALNIENTNGFGGELSLKFNVTDKLRLNIDAGYQDLSVDQEIHSLFREWNWRNWKRYFGDINDTNKANFTNKYVQILLKDTATYKGTFTPVQRLKSFPIIMTASYEVNLTEQLSVSPFLGGGVIFYTKKLYVEESWEKYFPELNNYVFKYSYRNFAPEIYGNPLLAAAGMTVQYNLGEYFAFTAGAKYVHMIDTGRFLNYKEFPVKSLFSARFGISFLY